MNHMIDLPSLWLGVLCGCAIMGGIWAWRDMKRVLKASSFADEVLADLRKRYPLKSNQRDIIA